MKSKLSHMRLRPKLSYAFIEANAQLLIPQAGSKDVGKLLTCKRTHAVQRTSACGFDPSTIASGPWSGMEILELRSCMHLPKG